MKRIAVLLLAGLLIACGGGGDGGGGGDDDLLVLREQNVSEENLRAYYRSLGATNPIGWGLICNGLDGLSEDAALNFFKNATEGSNANITVVAGATAVPGQQAVEADNRKVVRMIMDECK